MFYFLLHAACQAIIYSVARWIRLLDFRLQLIKNNTSNFSEDIYPPDRFSSSQTTSNDRYEIDNYLSVLFIIYALVLFVQVWLQTQWLILVKRKQINPWIRTGSICISILNFSTWLLDSITYGLRVKNKRSVIPIMDGFFGNETTRKIVALFVPTIKVVLQSGYIFAEDLNVINKKHKWNCS